MLFIKRLLYIKNEIDDYPFEKLINNPAKNQIEWIESVRSHTPKSLLAGRKSVHCPYKINARLLSCGSELDDTKERVKTTANKHRRHEYTSMSPLKLFNNNKSHNANNANINLK